LVDAQIAHDYGIGYPCMIEDASGGACGMAAFGAIFPGFEPGFVYTTPKVGGFELAVGVYDPANVGLAQLNRSPLPRLEGEASFGIQDSVRVFASGFWQAMEGTVPDTSGGVQGALKDITATAYGAQGGLMVTLGPVMIGGAGFAGQGLSPITHVDENQSAFDSLGTPRKSRGGFGLGAFTFESIHLKIAGGAGSFSWTRQSMTPSRSARRALLGIRSCSRRTWALRLASTRRRDPSTSGSNTSAPSTRSMNTEKREWTTQHRRDQETLPGGEFHQCRDDRRVVTEASSW